MNLKSKKGSVEILFLSIFVISCIAMLAVYGMMIAQINAQVYPIKQDVFYVVQNAYFALNKEELSYENYVVDEKVLFEKVSYLFAQNYNNVQVQNIRIHTALQQIEVVLEVTIKPVLLSDFIGDITITIKDKVNIKMMEVK